MTVSTNLKHDIDHVCCSKQLQLVKYVDFYVRLSIYIYIYIYVLIATNVWRLLFLDTTYTSNDLLDNHGNFVM